jgi:hypothetical protein
MRLEGWLNRVMWGEMRLDYGMKTKITEEDMAEMNRCETRSNVVSNESC